jgi:hypothetical protein
MANKNIIIGRVINVTGMIGVLAATVLFTFALVLILFRRGFGLDIPNLDSLVLVDGSRCRVGVNSTPGSSRDSLEASSAYVFAGAWRWQIA